MSPVLVGDIDGSRCTADFFSDGFGARLVAIHHYKMPRAVGVKTLHDAAPDSAGPARDDGHSILDFHFLVLVRFSLGGKAARTGSAPGSVLSRYAIL